MGARSIEPFLNLAKTSRLLAPNLKEMTLHLYTGNTNAGNKVAREIVRNHILALRWMNPNAVIYLREHQGQGVPKMEYSLWTGSGAQRVLNVDPAKDATENIARILLAARDPDSDDTALAASAGAGAAANAGSGAGAR